MNEQRIKNDTLGSIELIAKNNIKSDGMRSIYDLVKVADMQLSPNSTDSVVETNRQLLLDRSNVGISKYGVTLEKANLSEEAILQHALEEALDLANYLQTRLMTIRGQK